MRQNPLFAPLYALFADGNDTIFFAGAGGQIPEGSVFERVIRHRHPTFDRIGSVTLESGWEVLLGFEVLDLQKDLRAADDPDGAFRHIKARILEEESGKARYRVVSGVESFYEGGPKKQAGEEKQSPPYVQRAGTEIHHFRVWEEVLEDAHYPRMNKLLGLSKLLDFDDQGLSARGGATVVLSDVQTEVKGDLVLFKGSAGISVCSLRDNFCRKTGVENALKRMEESVRGEAGTPFKSVAPEDPNGHLTLTPHSGGFYFVFDMAVAASDPLLSKEPLGFSRVLGHGVALSVLGLFSTDRLGEAVQSLGEGGDSLRGLAANAAAVLLSQDLPDPRP